LRREPGNLTRDNSRGAIGPGHAEIFSSGPHPGGHLKLELAHFKRFLQLFIVNIFYHQVIEIQLRVFPLETA